MDAAQLYRLARHLREIALESTSNSHEERISASELSVVEDVARHPQAAIGDIARRTGLAQSLISRIVSSLRDAQVFTTAPDPDDRRKLQVSIDSQTRLQVFRERGSRSIEAALQQALPHLEPQELTEAIGLMERLLVYFDAPPVSPGSRPGRPNPAPKPHQGDAS